MNKIKTEVKWGLVFAVTTLVWMLIEKMMGWHDEDIEQHMYMTNLFAILAISIYVYALRDKRNQLDGNLTWKEGFFSGMMITGVVFLLSPITLWISVNIISPDFFPNMIDYAIENGFMDEDGAKNYFNFRNYVIQSALGAFFMGTITSALVAFFVKK
jgi:hypothetical protein